MNFLDLSLTELRNAIAKRELKASEVAEKMFSRAKTLNSQLNAFITFDERALDRAKAIDARLDRKEKLGPLAGIPIGIKDLLCTKDLLTTAGSKILKNYRPPYSSTVVERLEKSDAVLFGKTNLDEFAMGSSNETSAYGIVKNPWDPKFVPGGSSGGSAAAVAARMVAGAIGTDTGGSIRQPASYCSVVGMKPTYGRVSRYGIVAYASSLDQAGPMAPTVQDTALMLEAIAGFDHRDSTSAQKPTEPWGEQITDNLKGLRIGKPKEYFAYGIHPEIRNVVEKALEVAKAQGATIVDVSLPLTKYAITTYYLVATSEASSNLARYDGVRFGHRAESFGDVHDMYKKSRGEGFGAEVKRRIMLGTYALSSGYYDAYFKKACQVRRMIQDDFLSAFQKCDLILCPVTASPPFEIGQRIQDPLAMFLNDIYTTSLNLAGLPGMSVPGGFTKTGLPVGVQLIGPHFEEQRLFNVGHAIEKHIGLEKRRPHVF